MTSRRRCCGGLVWLGMWSQLPTLWSLVARVEVGALKQANTSSGCAASVACVPGTMTSISARLSATYSESLAQIPVMAWVSVMMSQPTVVVGEMLVAQWDSHCLCRVVKK